MRTERLDTLILGAGPSGLAAAYILAKAGKKPTILEKEKVSGGLMRSIPHGEFIVDVGRKELYNRLAKVDEFWSALLGNDYRTYEHRGGILYDGCIVDMSRKYLGVRRGMPWGMFLGAGLDLLWWRLRPGLKSPNNLEEYWYKQRGRRLTQIANQGFQEKLVGRKWVDVPLPEKVKSSGGESLLNTVKQAVARGLWTRETNTYKNVWRHPAKGSGQICEAMECGILKSGGRVQHGANIVSMAASITSVTAEVGGETITYEPTTVISSAPAEFLQRFLLPGYGEKRGGQRPSGPRKRVVVLAYLFLDEPPRFPHFWLQVTCRKMRVGRIANYAALNSDMVPKGKTAICCEYYCFGEDPLLELDERKMGEFALDECSRAGLVTREACFDTLVLKFPGADASQNRHNWFSPERQQLFQALRQFQNLYSVNRTDLDIATLAGIESAEAILSGDRQEFDTHFSPDVLGIRSEGKPFEFRNPVGVEV